MTNKKIFLTGKTGFIGKNILEFLEDSKYNVLAPSHQELELLDGEAVKNFLCRNKVDVVIHSALIPSHRKIKNPRDIAYRNLRMFFNIARNAQYFSKMIFFSSGAEYGVRHDLSKVKETDFDKHIPEDEHGFSKYVCSQYIDRSDKIVNLILFGIFGKYEDYQMRFISNAICKAIHNLPVTIKQNRTFSYLYIEDLCRIVKYFIESEPKYKIYNVAPNRSIDLLSIAKKVNEISGKDLQIIVHNPGSGKEYTASNSRLMNELKDFHFTPLEEAMKELYKWYEENKNTIDYNLLLYDP